MLVGHGTLRGCIMGFEDREPTEVEMQAMIERLDQEMTEGAFGMSLGLAYPPSCFAKTAGLPRSDSPSGYGRRIYSRFIYCGEPRR